MPMTEDTLMMAELPMAAEYQPATVQFEELYALYHEAIYRYLYRLVHRTDLAHDVFIHLHRQLQGNVRLLNPRAWLYSVAANSGYNHLRREQRLVKLIRGWLPLLDRAVSPEQEYARDEQRPQHNYWIYRYENDAGCSHVGPHPYLDPPTSVHVLWQLACGDLFSPLLETPGKISGPAIGAGTWAKRNANVNRGDRLEVWDCVRIRSFPICPGCDEPRGA
jgi:hypothetical protein